MANKVLAMTADGRITFCEAPEDQRGKGRCPHIFHQEPGETQQQFMDRCVYKEKKIIPLRLSFEEKLNLEQVNSKIDLDNCENGGYIPLPFPVWNNALIHEFSEQAGIPEGQLQSLLKKESYLDENDNIVKGKGEPTCAEALNKLADKLGYEGGITDIYVIPNYMRPTSDEGKVRSSYDNLYSQLIYNKANKTANQLQEGYLRILDNENSMGYNIRPANNHGFAIKSMNHLVNGKKGILRKYITGQSVPFSGRCVIEPDIAVEYGEIEVPPHVVTKVLEGNICEYLKGKGLAPKDIDTFIKKFDNINDNPNSSCTAFDLARLDNILQETNSVVIVERQPTLHTPSMIAMKARVSGVKDLVEEAAKKEGIIKVGVGNNIVERKGRVKGRDVRGLCGNKKVSEELKKMRINTTIEGGKGENLSVRMSPLLFNGFNADSDGDTLQITGLNNPEISQLALDEMSAFHPLIRNNPKFQQESLISATKDALYGLQSIFNATEK